MFATRDLSEVVAVGESPAAEDAYGPSPTASSTHRTKQIDLWMGGSYSRRSSFAKTSSHTSYDRIKVDQWRLTDKPLDKPQ
jgi:acyl-homoserine lactone acylase PvdQ